MKIRTLKCMEQVPCKTIVSICVSALYTKSKMFLLCFWSAIHFIILFFYSGRRITFKGQKDLDQIAGQVSLHTEDCGGAFFVSTWEL